MSLLSLLIDDIFDFGNALIHLAVYLMERGPNAIVMLGKTVHDLVSQSLISLSGLSTRLRKDGRQTLELQFNVEHVPPIYMSVED